MTQLLRINSSSRLAGSHSAAIADAFESGFRAKPPACTAITRNIADGSIPFIANQPQKGSMLLKRICRKTKKRRQTCLLSRSPKFKHLIRCRLRFRYTTSPFQQPSRLGWTRSAASVTHSQWTKTDSRAWLKQDARLLSHIRRGRLPLY